MKKGLFFAGLALILVANLYAQGISVKTVPLLASDQFDWSPSFRDDMGGVSLALRDPNDDLWNNPALFTDVKPQFLFAPRMNHWNYAQETNWRYNNWGPSTNISETTSASKIVTWPMAAIVRTGNTYLAGGIAAQTISAENTNKADFKATNYPLSLAAGHYFPSLKLAIGIGFNAVNVHGVDGVYLLYPDATRLSQKGWAREFNLGLAGRRDNQDQWYVKASRHTFKMKQTSLGVENKDENEGWYGEANYTRHMNDALDLAVYAAYDWKYHPKIPEYPLAGIPRDPGYTRGLNLGLGCRWQADKTLIGLDLIYEPIDVKTWADAAADTKLWDDRLIRKGDVTMRNDYQFHNMIIRSGVQIQPVEWLFLRTGANVRFYSYDYYQNDFIQQFERTGKPQREWTEFTWTGGASIHLNNLEFSYSLRLLMGTGILERQWFWFNRAEDFAKSDFIIPPTVQLNVTPVTYYTQYISLRYSF